MKYRDLQIQTQREAPNNARTAGFAWLVRAGYITRENRILPLGEQILQRLRSGLKSPSFLSELELPAIGNEQEKFFPLVTGTVDVIHCNSCGYTARKDAAQFRKLAFPAEKPLPMEKVPTPQCSTIEALADYLKLPKEKTAKALMFTRTSDARFIFVVIRGDMNLSETKLRNSIGEFRLAEAAEIAEAGASAGYASAVGLKNALIVVDDLIPDSPNLVAGANEPGYHLLNTNCGRDYIPEVTVDLTLAKEDDPCMVCGNPLSELAAALLATRSTYDFENILLAIAETHHDEKGLVLPRPAAPFEAYLMQIPGKEQDTRARAEEICTSLLGSGVSVLFDDRDERAGVKFNDADLIGCPIRITVGEKALQKGMVELKPRKAKETRLVPIEGLLEEIVSQ